MRGYGLSTASESCVACRADPSSGSLVVTGTFATDFSMGSTTLTNAGSVDVFVARMNSTGGVRYHPPPTDLSLAAAPCLRPPQPFTDFGTGVVLVVVGVVLVLPPPSAGPSGSGVGPQTT